MKYSTHIRRAFTLLEVLIVLAIIAVVMSLLLCAIQTIRESARKLTCKNNLKQIGLALHNYHASYGRFPPALCIKSPDPDYGGPEPNPGPPSAPGFYFSWLARLLPYIEQEQLYKQVDWNGPRYQRPINETPIKTWQCPSDPHAGDVTQITTFQPRGKSPDLQDPSETWTVATTSYLGVNGTNQLRFDGVFYPNSHVRLEDIKDGPAQTVMVGERGVPFWMSDGNSMWFTDLGYGTPTFGSPGVTLGVNESEIAPKAGPMTNRRPYYEQKTVTYGPCPVDGPDYDETKIPWTATRRPDCKYFFWSYHPPGGAHFLFADGHVSFLPYEIGQDVINKLATRNGKEVVSGEW